MGLIDTIFGKRDPEPEKARVAQAFKTFTEYAPVFSTWQGGVYEMELTRAAIDRFASSCLKLKPEVIGTAEPRLARAIRTSPNPFMTWPKFLYRLATIYECDTTAYVVKAFAPDGETCTGIWPLKAEAADVIDVRGVPWIRFLLASGDQIATELSNVCIISKFQYESDFFGSGNVLDKTLDIMSIQDDAQVRAIRDAASIRFIGSVAGFSNPVDLAEKRKAFSDENLSAENKSGIAVYDSTFQNVQQIKPYNYTIPTSEMERIKESVYDYFGINSDILQNHYQEDHWNAYYEGKVEPFAIQLGEGLSHMLYTQRERANNAICFSSNRMEYATSASKRNMIRDMLDRGVMSINEAREILQMTPLPKDEYGDFGEKHVIRGEYVDATMLNKIKTDKDPEFHDETKKDTDLRGTKDTEGLEE